MEFHCYRDTWMEYNSRVAARVDDSTSARIEDVCEQYDLKESQVVRQLVNYGLDVVEDDGISAVMEERSSRQKSDS